MADAVVTKPAVEIRRAHSLAAATDTGTLTGYAAVFNSQSRDLGGFVETIRPGAFKRSLKASQDVVALFNHSGESVLGRVGAGTLRLSEDARGLRYEIDLPDTTVGRDLRTLVERGDVAGGSFGFRVIEDDWDFTRMPARRELREVELIEVTVTPIPAYLDTMVAARTLDAARGASQVEAERKARLKRLKRWRRWV